MASQRPLRSAEIGDQPIYCSAFRVGILVPLCPFGCAIDHTSGANAPFCDGWHKLDPAGGRETPRRRSPLARPCHGGRSSLHRPRDRAWIRGSGHSTHACASENRICGQRAATSSRRRKADVAGSEAATFCAPAKLKMGWRTVPQSPARTAGCSGCAAGSGWHSRDA